MSLYDLIHETLLSVTSNKVRSALTILGIVVGISAVILLVSIGQGAQASITSSIQSAGANLLTVSPGGGRFGGFGRSGATAPAGGGSQSEITLTAADVNTIEKLPNVADVAYSVNGNYTVAAPGVSVSIRTIGAGGAYDSVNAITESSGSFISAEDIRGATRVAVLGPTALTDLFQSGVDPIGQRIRVKGVEFTIIGVTKSKGGTGFGNADEVVYIPATTAQRYLTGDTNVDAISVQAASASSVTDVTNEITAALISAHNVKDSTQPGFSVLSQAEILSTASTITGTFTTLLAAIAGISLLVGGIGIMNMMLTTVTERTREIGLRKAIGARPRDITLEFLVEAVALCVAGGVIGIAIGWGGAEIITATGVLTTLVSWQAIALAVGVCAAIGIVFGFYPANRASKLDPIEALRYQ